MKKGIAVIALLGCFVFIYSSCKHDNNLQPAAATTPSNNTNNPVNPADTALCFERDILPIFTSNCAKSGCHDPITHAEGYVLNNWQNITAKKFSPGNPNNTEIYEKIIDADPSDRMPPAPEAPLSAAQINLVYRWIAEGGKNTTGCTTGCDTNTYTYAGTIKPMMDTYCKGCHNSTTSNKGVMLDTYGGVYATVLSGTLLKTIRHESGVVAMPFASNKLSDCQVRQVEKWVATGAVNN